MTTRPRLGQAGGANLTWREAILAPAEPRFGRVGFATPLWKRA